MNTGTHVIVATKSVQTIYRTECFAIICRNNIYVGKCVENNPVKKRITLCDTSVLNVVHRVFRRYGLSYNVKLTRNGFNL